MPDNENPYVLSDGLNAKFPMPRIKAPDDAVGIVTSAGVLTEIEQEVVGHAKRMGELLATFKRLRLKETGTFDRAMKELADIAQMRGD